MANGIEIENIEQMRYREGIRDVELHQAIRKLETGDFVKVTFLTRTGSNETLTVRITSIRGSALRGKLASTPVSASLASLRAGSRIAFSTAHIHSIPKGRPTHGQ